MFILFLISSKIGENCVFIYSILVQNVDIKEMFLRA